MVKSSAISVYLFIILLLSLKFVTVNGQVDTVNAKNGKLLVHQLQAGKSYYLAYSTDSLLARKTSGDLWERETQFTLRNNQPVIRFTWNVLKGDTFLMKVVNICDRQTLAPLFHQSVFAGKMSAYNYSDQEMFPADTIKNNKATERKELKLPLFNWEQDLETLPLLPIRKIGQQFAIAFMDPNEKGPSYRNYNVIGEELLGLAKGVFIDSWLLKIIYGENSYAFFWISKNGREVIKVKEYFMGNYYFKVRQY